MICFVSINDNACFVVTYISDNDMFCFDLHYSRLVHRDALPRYPKPEIQRSALESVVLTTLSLGLAQPSVFAFLRRALEAPEPAAVAAAVHALYQTGAVTLRDSADAAGGDIHLPSPAALAANPNHMSASDRLVERLDRTGVACSLSSLGQLLSRLGVDYKVGKLLVWG
jgi:HrpA-like RNA helicase